MKKFKFSVEIVGDTHQGGDVWSTAWDGHYFDTIEEAYKVVENLDDRELRDIESDGHLSKDDTTAYVSIIKDVFEEDFIDSEEVEEIQFHKIDGEWVKK